MLGFSDKAMKSFYSYLTNIAVFVSLGTAFLEAATFPKDLHWELYYFCLHNNISSALSNDHMCLYVDDTIMIFCQHKDVMEIENVLNKEFANTCDWFVDNHKVPTHFVEDKTKCILFSRDTNLPELIITYKRI